VLQAAKIVLSTPSVEDRFSEMIVRSRPLRILWVIGLLSPFFVVPGVMGAQSATLTTEENFRAQENGTVLGRLRAGLSVEVLEATDDWLQFDLEGWVWIQSLREVNRGRFSWVVSAEGG
jgi:hypothetical protein